MIKTITIGQKINGVAQTSKLMMLSGDKILLVDATTGLPPKKVTTKMVGKDLHIFADGATEPSAILGDYSEFSASSTIQGIAHNGAYYNYIPTDAGVMELSSSPVAPAVAKESSFISSAGWWGLGILALGGGVAAAAGGGGGGGGSATTTTPTGTTQTAVLVDDVLIGVSYTTSSGLSGKTGSDGSFSFKPGDTVTFKVGNATLGSFTPTVGDLVVTISDLAGNDVTKTENLAKFLQSLDSDTNASTITISTATANSITTAANVQDDPTAGGQVTITVTNPDLGALTDTTAPSATIVLSDYTLNQGETALVTITFTEAVSGLTNADVTVENGSLTALSTADGGITWTATFTPTASINDPANLITLANASYIDQAGNLGSTASNTYAINTLIAPPTPFSLTINDDESSTANITGGTITYTFAFDKEVTGFSADDINITGGTKGTFSGSGKDYTLVVTPASLTEGNISISVSAGVATASDGSQNLAATSTQAIDTIAPPALSMTLAADTGIDTTDNITSNHTMNISTPASGATWEYSLDGGSSWQLGSGTSFNLTDNTAYAINAIQVRQTDTAGNISPVAKNAGAITIDIKAPILTITDNEPNITANMDGSDADGSTDADGADILYTFKFDEDVTGFDISDIQITNGTAETFTKISAKEYTLGVIPDVGVEGILSVNVANTVYSDIAGNTASASSMTASTPQAIDMLAPLPLYNLTSYTSATNNKIIITMDSPLDEVHKPEPSDFTVKINTKIVPVHSIEMLGDKVTLIMSETFNDTESVEVIYQDDTTDIINAIQDQAGNDATSFTFLKPDITPPTLTNLFFGNSTLSIGDSTLVTMHFSEDIKDLIITFENGTVTNLSPSADDASTWTATFTAKNDIEDMNNTFTVTSFHDLNLNANIPNSATDSITYAIDTRAPALSISDNDPDIALAGGGAILYTFTFTEAVKGFSVADVSVVGGEKATAFTSGVNGDTTYTLLVTPTTNFEGNLTVDVADGKLTDLFGNPNIKADQSIQVVDTKPLTKPSFALKTDSGTDEFDGITNVSTITVKVDDKAASWQYSLNGGTSWIDGNGTNFNLASNATYAADAIQLRQYDDSGNASAIASNGDTLLTDKTAPRIATGNAITLDGASGEITIAMSEILDPSVSFENFVVSINGINQIAQGASTDGTNVILTVTPFANTDSIRVSYADRSHDDVKYIPLTDLAGNVSVSFTKVIADTNTPTATITLSDSAIKAGETSSVEIVFSEAVNPSTFTLSDLSAQGGVLSALATSDNIRWTALFTPTTDIESTTNIIHLSDSYQDTTGTTGTSADSLNYTIDTAIPSVTITDNKSATTVGSGVIVYTFIFSETVTGFTADDINVTNGTKGTFSGSGSTYTLEVTPNTGFDGNITVDVAANKAFDSAGNSNSVATQSLQDVDTLVNTPTISTVAIDDIVAASESSNLIISGTGEAGATITLAVTNQTTIVGSDGSWSITVVDPITVFGQGTENLSVTQTDLAGNTSSIGMRPITIDTIAPQFIDAIANIGSDSIAITFNEALDNVNFTSASNFILEITNSLGVKTIYDSDSQVRSDQIISAMSTSGNTVTLILDTGIHDIDFGDTIRIAYSDTVGNDTATIQDLLGNDVLSFGYYTASVTDTNSAPVLTDMVADGGDDTIVLTFNESLNSALANLPATTDFQISINGSVIVDAVDTISILDKQVTLTMDTTALFNADDLIKVVYTDNASTVNAIQDINGQDALSFTYTNTAVL